MSFNNHRNFILLSLLIKIGAAPAFLDTFNDKNYKMKNNFLLLTWQKIAPFIIIMYIYNNSIIYYFIIFSSIVRAVGGLNQTSLRKIISYSSNHTSWLLEASDCQ